MFIQLSIERLKRGPKCSNPISCNFTLLKLTCRKSKMKIITLLVCATLVVTITSYPVKEDTTTKEPEISTVYDFCKAICDAGGCGAPLCDCGCPPLHKVFGINFHNNNNLPMIETTTIMTTKKVRVFSEVFSK